MNQRKPRTALLAEVICLSALLTCGASVTAAQDGQQGVGGSRQIIAEEFTKSRPKKPRTSTNNPSSGARQSGNQSASARPGPRYKRTNTASTITANTSVASNNSGSAAAAGTANTLSASLAKVGVTIWRLRPGRASDEGARILVQGGEGELVPERVSTGTVLRVNDRVRLSIEAPREGYLYVIDRELYADGTSGDPYLIFPTTRTNGGDNRVRPGKLIDIPAQDDKPNYFRLIPTPGRGDQVGEVLSVIITSEPLENLKLTDQPIKLSEAQVQNWEKRWGARTEQYELEGGEGKTWTKEEREAARSGDGSRMLTQEDPSPQTVFLVEARNNKGLLVTVPLRYSK